MLRIFFSSGLCVGAVFISQRQNVWGRRGNPRTPPPPAWTTSSARGCVEPLPLPCGYYTDGMWEVSDNRPTRAETLAKRPGRCVSLMLQAAWWHNVVQASAARPALLYTEAAASLWWYKHSFHCIQCVDVQHCFGWKRLNWGEHVAGGRKVSEQWCNFQILLHYILTAPVTDDTHLSLSSRHLWTHHHWVKYELWKK